MEDNTNTDQDQKSKWVSWLKKSGIVVFLFFLVKGLVWLAIAAFVWMGLTK